MLNFKCIRPVLVIAVFFVCLLPVISESDMAAAQTKRPMELDDFNKFRTVSGQRISNNGEWVVYVTTPREGDGVLTILNLNNNKKYTVERGSGPWITEDSKWAGYMIIPHKKTEEEKKAEKEAEKEAKERGEEPEKEPEEKNRLEIMDLSSGEKILVDRVKSARPTEDSKWVAYLLEKPEEKEEEKKEEEPVEKEESGEKKEKKTTGTELVLKNLGNGSEERFQFVTSYGFDENSRIMYFIVSAENDEDDGIYVKTLDRSDQAIGIATGKGKYQGITFNEDQDRFLFLSDRDDQESDISLFSVYTWEIGSSSAEKVLDPNTTRGFPLDMQLASSGFSWSEDNNSLFFNIQEREQKKEEEEDNEEKAKVIVWHWKDVMIKSEEQAERLGETTGSRHAGGSGNPEIFRSVYHMDSGNFMQLQVNSMQRFTNGPNDKFAIESDQTPYLTTSPWRSTMDRIYDTYVVDMKDGSKKLIDTGSLWTYQWSNNGDYLLQYSQPHWYVFDPETGVKRNLTGELEEAFWNTDDDHPDLKRAWGLAGWTEDDEGVLIYDKFDVWYFPISKDGDPVNMTKGVGRENNLRFRYYRVDPEEEFININEPMWFNALNYKTKATGIYEVSSTGRDPREIFTVDASVGGIRKAKDADIFMFTRSLSNQYGDIYVSDKSFRNMRKISDANPDNLGIIMGKSQLIDYINGDGITLQAILTLPENYVEGKRYPMIVYFYEIVTNGVHRYSIPSFGSGFPKSHFVSNGYVVLEPDIIYTDGYPGPSSVKCVVPASKKVIEMGIADPDAIAITGHSWGGYQTAYIVTQTDMFACAYAGAPVSNMTSAYGGIRWASGINRAMQYERTQSRIGGSLWENLERYIENSPLFFADRVNTPILLLHGDEDGAVPWYQSIEYFIAFRRLEKPCWFLQYETEPHGLRGQANRKDFTIRRLQFFDHFLKGEPMPKWMEEGQSITKDLTVEYKKK
ncbi:alpha/beta hydrolase family protein [candidate division KSB1 bacterium]